MRKILKKAVTIMRHSYPYYMLKWGFKKEAVIRIEADPDPIKVMLNATWVKYSKGLLKIIYKMIEEGRLEYFKNNNVVCISDKQKIKKKEVPFDVFSIEVVVNLVDLNLEFNEYDDFMYQVVLQDDISMVVRKRILDICSVRENFIDNQYSFIYPYLQGARIADIGAYIGDSALLFSSKGAARVFAYEPHPELFSILQKNVCINNLQGKIQCFNLGVGQESSELELKEDTVFGPTAAFSLKQCALGKKIILKLESLEQILKDILPIDVLKMDCEGYEYPSLLTCSPEIIKKVKIIVLEFHGVPNSLLQYLDNAEFVVEIITDKFTSDGRIGLLFARNNTYM